MMQSRPVTYSELLGKYGTRAEIAKYLCERCNELGRMEIDKTTDPVEVS